MSAVNEANATSLFGSPAAEADERGAQHPGDARLRVR